MPSVWSLKSEENAGNGPDTVDAAIGALLSLRGIGSEEDRVRFLEPDYDRDLHDPFLFSSMRKVMDRFRSAKQTEERIGLFGDFDADGITSTVLLHEALSKLGIPVSVYLPDKHVEGHGLSLAAIDSFSKDGVSLIVTVDCGMTDHESIAEARRRNMDTIVIDHHHVPKELPDAYAFINPRLPGETYPFLDLCGAGISFKVLQAVFLTFFPDERDQLKWFLDVAAVGTVADVMPLIGENRTIVTYGLVVLSKSKRHGFREMISRGRIGSSAGRAPVARDISFQIAPRLNAASRMAHAKAAHDLLIEPDADRAKELAEILESYNTDRQKVSAEIAKSVQKIAVSRPERRFVFAAHENFHFGVVGLVAGKIANEFRKPTIVLTKGSEISRGSLRSIPELNIIEVIEACGDLLERFGGHAQAAGLTVRNENLDALEERLERLAAERMTGERLEPETVVDMRLPQSLLTLDFARKVKRLAPFGEGNPEPVFLLESVVVADVRMVGSDGKHLKLTLSVPGKRPVDAIGFSLAARIPDLAPGDSIDILFQLDENEWNGSVNLQLKLLDMRRAVGM
ncbi:MAG: single-stranded-DNA-specific exonuclease RecJ [Candidatus Moranbacteria bacterium]|nr:single-stranded-DNA-specific exonuclease RecJ [Candidatus Moranbacteria bacterium]